MHLILRRTFLPTLMTASILGVSLLATRPASADDRVLQDAGIGAAAGAVTGIIRGDSIFKNAVNGAAAGAAVNAVHGSRKNRRNRNFLQDVGAGAVGGTVSGAVTNRRHPGRNAVTGAAAGAAIHFLRKK